MITKFCPKCSTDKDVKEFGLKSSAKDGRQSACKPCRALYAHSWYQDNRALHIQRSNKANAALRRRLREQLWNYLSDKNCLHCPENDPRVLEFDHRDPKHKVLSIATCISQVWTWNRILVEIAKCDILCANCHRRKTYEQLGWYVPPG